jgi:small-conductance mechanosensitive channel
VLEELWNAASVQQALNLVLEWFMTYTYDVSTAFQFLGTAGALLLSYLITKPLRNLNDSWLFLKLEQLQLKETFESLTLPAFWCLIQWAFVLSSQELLLQTFLSRTVASLLTAWLLIRFMTGFVREASLAKFIAVTAWTLAAFDIVGFLQPTLLVLDSVSMDVGELHISVLSIVKGLITLLALLWGATLLSRVIEARLKTYDELDSSLQVLFSKVVKVTFVVLAIFFGFSSMGIDMSAFAVLGGAVGVGLGFGLQKVVSNLVCGVILLVDRSIKPGDVVALENGLTYGVVNKLTGRCVSVRTRAGKEHLIPNEDFITQKVENWSYSDSNVRLKLPISVAYDSDVNKVIDVLTNAANDILRVNKFPEPAVRLRDFGDSAIKFELRFWIRDPQNGINNVKSEVYIKVWELFKENGISIPFPQRDLHLKTIDPNETKIFNS